MLKYPMHAYIEIDIVNEKVCIAVVQQYLKAILPIHPLPFNARL